MGITTLVQELLYNKVGTATLVQELLYNKVGDGSEAHCHASYSSVYSTWMSVWPTALSTAGSMCSISSLSVCQVGPKLLC